MKTSVFDLFKIGIGPSSSHTVGPMRAALRFTERLLESGRLNSVRRVFAELYGSLALTGIGHGTDRALLLGLSGEKPEELDPETIRAKLDRIRSSKTLRLLSVHAIGFEEARDLVFHEDKRLPGHPNGMKFTAFDTAGDVLSSEIYYSVGGGFIVRGGEAVDSEPEALHVPYPFSNGAELLEQAERNGLPIWDLMLRNESALRSEQEVRDHMRRIWSVMDASIERGLHTEGILPGGLKVRRRAPRLLKKIESQGANNPLKAMDWPNVFAMAVNEENAAGGRVVTAPTNGAAGLIPAVGRYYRQFLPESSNEGLMRYLLTAGAIGILYKENASISGAEVGCQGEVGVACSMAAAGLAGALGASNEEVEHAAEIGMEHHLGMTCDPIGGLVQIPCIERNAIGAVKAINACRMAMQEGGEHKVSLDQVIRTMYQTGLDMQSRYKETALAGLAVNVKDC
ncbi:MAG: L-serine ammonia-lyase [Acidobacteriaceae bacterium]|nr:L-serine ammonia-lyase [Acidobacteriaceae bacterium]MBV9498377.1 L-serine ammonia-lyase [Acidobacteriaceae bacterium]